MKNKEKTKGFTLLEMLISLVVISVGVLGIFSAISKYSQNTQSEKENLIASYLCQEGIEIVKNRRDTNWILIANGSSIDWDAGLTNCASGCEADYLTDMSSDLPAWTGKSLYLDTATRSYKYIDNPLSTDVETKYTRRINIASGGDYLDITVIVSWPGNSTGVAVRETIYNWK
jgi:prepilin-type N-terminal cleavage/methylation domain-containing protein